MNPSIMLKELKKEASPRTCRTLDAIYQICIEQEERGVYDFSVSTIAKLGNKRGVPKAQSLRNKTGEKYRALLLSFEDQHKDRKKRPKKESPDDWIEEIQSPKHKLLARTQAAELAAANKKLRDFIPPGTRIEVRDHQNFAHNHNEVYLTDLERRALEYLISEEFLGTWDFSISEYGEILDSGEKVVLRAATVDAVKKVLENM